MWCVRACVCVCAFVCVQWETVNVCNGVCDYGVLRVLYVLHVFLWVVRVCILWLWVCVLWAGSGVTFQVCAFTNGVKDVQLYQQHNCSLVKWEFHMWNVVKYTHPYSHTQHMNTLKHTLTILILGKWDYRCVLPTRDSLCNFHTHPADWPITGAGRLWLMPRTTISSWAKSLCDHKHDPSWWWPNLNWQGMQLVCDITTLHWEPAHMNRPC